MDIVRYIPLILAGVLLNAAAQLLLKQGMIQVGQFELGMANLLEIGPRVAVNPFVLLGLASYVISVGAWLVVLSRVDVSVAYPMVSLGYIVTVILGRVLFNEAVTAQRVLGVLVICVGVFLVARS
ncbi:MAG: EamA family transporter [Chloroflexi bacterium]|nr:EamA family transporter [Chloroflexota bacterium]